jgi:hypothetical protein
MSQALQTWIWLKEVLVKDVSPPTTAQLRTRTIDGLPEIVEDTEGWEPYDEERELEAVRRGGWRLPG